MLSKPTIPFAIMIAFILSWGCHGFRPTEPELTRKSSLSDWDIFDICGSYAGFANVSDRVVIICQPFVVREVKGRLLWEGGWPGDRGPLFEIRRTGEMGARIYSVYADLDGNFVIKDIPQGRYCYRASNLGFIGYEGIVIVEKHANPKNEIVIEMFVE